MDNWLRFQYCFITELWGRRKKAGAGDGKPCASEVPVQQEKPLCNGKALRGPKWSREAGALSAGKSRYSL